MKLRWNWAGVLRTLRDSAVTDRKCAGLYRPNDLDSRTRDLVIEVLRRKHPETRAPRSIRTSIITTARRSETRWESTAIP